METACKQAGFDNIATIEAPIAALMAFGLVNDNTRAKKVLVFDMGGNALEVSLLENNNRYLSYVVKAKRCDMSVNGRSFTKSIANICLKSL